MSTERRQLPSEVIGAEEPCVYLPGRLARMRYRYLAGCPKDAYQEMLEHGWRRFGRVFFRPARRGCAECKSLRVAVEGFQPNRSMQRNLRRNRDLNLLIRRPRVSAVHLALYDRYHADMEGRRRWPVSRTSPEAYGQSFVEGHGEYGHEILFLDGERLVAVSLVDLLPRAVSSVYTFYDPQERSRGLGVFSILTQIRWAQSRGIPYLYLGFRVDGNPSMSYKGRYRPHEILAGRPEMSEEPSWRPV
ncbi:MAG: arginyltransferase [Acidobacteria bacterium]|nr:arginyltransferase [Acidobacteriota bacterium]